MQDTCVYVKGIVKKDQQYLVLRKWMDDRIMDPHSWEFVDSEVLFGESPDEAVLRSIKEKSGLEARIDKILYTWSKVLGDTHAIGITYLCEPQNDDEPVILSEDYDGYKWVSKYDFSQYIENKHVITDLEGVDL